MIAGVRTTSRSTRRRPLRRHRERRGLRDAPSLLFVSSRTALRRPGIRRAHAQSFWISAGCLPPVRACSSSDVRLQLFTGDARGPRTSLGRLKSVSSSVEAFALDAVAQTDYSRPRLPMSPLFDRRPPAAALRCGFDRRASGSGLPARPTPGPRSTRRAAG